MFHLSSTLEVSDILKRTFKGFVISPGDYSIFFDLGSAPLDGYIMVSVVSCADTDTFSFSIDIVENKLTDLPEICRFLMLLHPTSFLQASVSGE